MKKLYLALAVALLLPQIVLGFTLPKGAEVLTSPTQIKDYKILGQYGKTGSPGSYLYGVRKEVKLGFTPTPTQDVNVTNGTFTNLNSTKVNSTFTSSTYLTVSSTINTDTVKSADVVGSSILTDGGLNIWTTSSTLTNWTITDVGVNGRIAQELITVQEGQYSASSTDVAGDFKIIEQLKSSLTVGASYDVTGYGYSTSGEADIIVLNNTFALATQAWNFTTDVWDTVAIPAGFTANHNLVLNSATASWQTNSATVTVPASGKINTTLVPNGAGATVAFDNISLKLRTIDTAKTLFDFSNGSTPANLNSTDRIFSFGTTGGTARNYFEQDGIGGFLTDYTAFNFSHKGITNKYSASNISITSSTLTQTFGQPVQLGIGYTALIYPNATGGNGYIAWTDGTNWFTATSSRQY